LRDLEWLQIGIMADLNDAQWEYVRPPLSGGSTRATGVAGGGANARRILNGAGTEGINTVTDFFLDLVTKDTYYLISEAALPKWDCYLGRFGYS
jgi:hypothetical protein